MQYPTWKQRALAALKRQEQIEQNSGYDVRESLMAVSTMQQWVIENSCEDQAEFLMQLEAYYHQVRQNWVFPGEYSGGTATLGSCRNVIAQAILNEDNPLIEARLPRDLPTQQPITQVSKDTSALPIRRWVEQRYPHWFMGWRECFRIELKSFVRGILISSLIFLLIYLGFYTKW